MRWAICLYLMQNVCTTIIFVLLSELLQPQCFNDAHYMYIEDDDAIFDELEAVFRSEDLSKAIDQSTQQHVIMQERGNSIQGSSKE